MRFLHCLLIGTIPSAIATFLPDYSQFLADPLDGLSSDISGVDSYTLDPNLGIAGALDETAVEPLTDFDETAPLLIPDDGFWTSSDNECSQLSKRSRMKLRAAPSCPAVAPQDIPQDIPQEIPEEKRFCRKDQIPGCCEPEQMLGNEWYAFITASCQDYNPFNPFCQEPNVYCCDRIWFDHPKVPGAFGRGVNCINAVVFF